MGVYRRGRIYQYDFVFRSQRFKGSTHLAERAPAEAFEAEMKRALRLRDTGLAPQFLTTESPRFQDWAEVYYRAKAKTAAHPDEIERLIRVVLRFWGARPRAVAADTPDPYHDLRLADPIHDPRWIDRFEAWMEDRGSAGSTRNHYRSTMSGMYRVALLPRFREATGMTMNPFRDLPRDRDQARTATVTVEELRRWIAAASYHVRLAVAIAALAPKLRLGNILHLRWRDQVDPTLTWITVTDHKTARSTRAPLVVPVSDELRTILEDARRRFPTSAYVVTYRNGPVGSIRAGVAAAARAAGLIYGRAQATGVTFHTLRHAMATLLAELGLSEKLRQEMMGHARIATTQRYTHLRPVFQRDPHAALAKAVGITDLVTAPGRRAVRPKAAAATGVKSAGTEKPQSA